MSRLLALSLLVASPLACGDDGSPSADETGSGGPGSTSTTPMTVTEAASSTGDATATSSPSGTGSSGTPGDSSGEPGTTAGDDTVGSTGSVGTDTGTTGDAGSTGDASTGAGACAAIPFTVVDAPGFNGAGFCEGVQQNAVLTDAQAVSDHNDLWCASVAMCVFPEPPCSPAPALPAEGEQIVYVFGMDSGCEGLASISQVLDCGDTIEVHYLIGGVGMCGSIVHAWAAAAIPASDAEIVFVPG